MDSFPYHKSVEELTFTDDFMFGTIMKHKPVCKGVLERLLHFTGIPHYKALKILSRQSSRLSHNRCL